MRRMTITEASNDLGISPKTLARWEKLGKISSPLRDFRGWRVYLPDDIERIKKFKNRLYSHKPEKPDYKLNNEDKDIIDCLREIGEKKVRKRSRYE